MKKPLAAFITLVFISACGKPTTETEGEDLLKSQREAMEKAKQVEDELQKSLDERMEDVN